MSDSRNKNLLLFICKEAESQDDFGAIKLNKTLWFADMISYLKTGKYISNFEYVKQDQGPTPDPAQFLSLRDDLVNSGSLSIENREHFGAIVKKAVANIDPDLSEFTDEEIDIIKAYVYKIRNKSARELSEKTHNLGWKLLNNFDKMGPKEFLMTHKPLNSKEKEFFINNYLDDTKSYTGRARR